MMISFSKVTRVEVIDHTQETPPWVYPHTARKLIGYGVNVEIDLEDDGRTLKILLTRPWTDTP